MPRRRGGNLVPADEMRGSLASDLLSNTYANKAAILKNE